MGQRKKGIARFYAGMLAGLVLAGIASVAVPLGPSSREAGASTARAATTQITSNFWLTTPAGHLYAFGASDYGDPGGSTLKAPIVTMFPSWAERGYWMVASDGGVFAYGAAHFYGSTGSLHLNKPIVGMSPTPDQHGYWLVASDGGIFSFGDAHFYGSTGGITLNKSIVGMARTTDGKGYWLVASDGGVFAFGDTRFYGSTAGRTGDPVEKLVPTSSEHGYWVVQQDGTVTPFGDASSQTLAPPALIFKPTTAGDKAVTFALLQLGKPYIWGGNGPVGYDCSGLALASWEHGADIGFARVADDQYKTTGTTVSMSNLRAGDLVFWGTDQAAWTTVYHTAIFVGGNRIVEATGNHVQLNVLNQWGTDDLMPVGREP
jgi:cell wall-associated NlpC family hydrolase